MQLTIDLIEGTQLAQVPRPRAPLMVELSGGAPLTLEARWLLEDREHPEFTVRHEGRDLLRLEGLERLGALQGDRLHLQAPGRRPIQERWQGTAELLFADAQILKALVTRAPAVLQPRLAQHQDHSLETWPWALDLAAFKELRRRWSAARGAVESELLRFEQSVMRPLRELGRLEQRLGVPVRLRVGPPDEDTPPGSGGGPPLHDPDPDPMGFANKLDEQVAVSSTALRAPQRQAGLQDRARMERSWISTPDPGWTRRAPRSSPARQERRRIGSEQELQRLLAHLEVALGEAGTLTPAALLSAPEPDGGTR